MFRLLNFIVNDTHRFTRFNLPLGVMAFACLSLVVQAGGQNVVEQNIVEQNIVEQSIVEQKTEEQAFPVYTEQVQYKLVKRTLYTSGKLVNKSQQKLSFKTAGRIKGIYVEEGQYVKQGQLLAELDQEEISAQVKQAESLYQNAQRHLKRLSQLHHKKLIPLAELQSAQTQVDVSASNLRIAKFNQKHASIRAPVNGTILKRLVEENEFVASFQSSMLLGAEKQGWIIRSKISDKDIIRVSVGDPALIHFDAYQHLPFSGFVSEVSAAADERSQLFEVEIALDPTTLRLHSGFIGQLELRPQSEDRVAWVPIEAVVEAKKGKAKIFEVLPNNQVVLKEVTIGWLDSGKVAISQGIENDSYIVTRGATFLSEGTYISSANASPGLNNANSLNKANSSNGTNSSRTRTTFANKTTLISSTH